MLKAFEIVKSDEGRNLRSALMKNVLYLRGELKRLGVEIVGNPSAIVSAKVGDEALARMVSEKLPSLGVVANLVEFPAVAKGSARFRLQVMANHTKTNIDELIGRLYSALDDVQPSYKAYRAALADKTPEALPAWGMA